MANTFFGLTIGASGLNASNVAINTAAHNISNVKTKGYTKQVATQQATSAIRVYSTYGTVGTGVEVSQIDQLRSQYYDSKYWNNNANYGKYSSFETSMGLIEGYLDEFNLSGFTTEYSNLFNAIDTLTTDPSSDVARSQMLNYAQSLCEYFGTVSDNLASVQKSANDEVKTTVDSINTIAGQIALYNRQINTVEVNGGQANDLRDARALLVDELSKYINTTVKETDMGSGLTEYIVYIDGQKLVDGYDCNELVCKARATDEKRNASDIDGLYDVEWVGGMEFNMYRSSFSGSLRAAIDIRDGCNKCYEVTGLCDDAGNFLKDADGKITDVQDMSEADYNSYVSAGYHKDVTTYIDSYKNSDYKGVPYYQSQLNTFVKSFTAAFNEIIRKGDLGGEPVQDFFVSKYNEAYLTAGTVCVNRNMIDDVSLLPMSFDTTKGETNTDMAKELFELKEKDILNHGTFLENLQSIVSVAFIDTSRARNFSSNYQSIKETIENQRLSVSGVDEDEEAVDLVKYKEAYGLASKVISVMQEIYNKLIEQTGV